MTDYKPPPQHTLELARKLEKEAGEPRYIVLVGTVYEILDKYPLIGGPWWTSDGIRHG